MEDNNTIKAVHYKIINGKIRYSSKQYYWHIPKKLRLSNIQKGDIVLVKAKNEEARVIVVDVFREDIETTGKRYKSVIEKVNSRVNFDELKAEKAEAQAAHMAKVMADKATKAAKREAMEKQRAEQSIAKAAKKAAKEKAKAEASNKVK